MADGFVILAASPLAPKRLNPGGAVYARSLPSLKLLTLPIAYRDFLKQKGYEVTYIEAKDKKADIRNLLVHLKEKGVDEIHYCDTVDHWLEKRITRQGESCQLKIVRYESPLFLLNNEQVDGYFSGKKRFYQTDFYTHQRKYFKILVDDKLQPEGGKWTSKFRISAFLSLVSM